MADTTNSRAVGDGGAADALAITVNGQARDVPVGSTIADLVQALGLSPSQVAVERNRVLVRRAEHPAIELQLGDQLEIVTFFGGG